MKKVKVTYMDGIEETYPTEDNHSLSFTQGMYCVYSIKETGSGKLYVPPSEVPVVYIPLHNIRKLEVIEGE